MSLEAITREVSWIICLRRGLDMTGAMSEGEGDCAVATWASGKGPKEMEPKGLTDCPFPRGEWRFSGVTGGKK
jgi:hypothetical protein